MDEVTLVNVDMDGELWAVMVYLAALAYPESYESRDHFILAMKAHCVRYAQRQSRMTRAAGSFVTRAITAQQHRGSMRLGIGRIMRRLEMAEVIIPNLLESLSSPALQIRTSGSITQRIDDLQRDRSTAMSQWSESKRVLHLAIALRSIVLARMKEPNWHVISLLHRPEWVRSALVNAEMNAQILRALHQIKGTDLVRLVQKC